MKTKKENPIQETKVCHISKGFNRLDAVRRFIFCNILTRIHERDCSIKLQKRLRENKREKKLKVKCSHKRCECVFPRDEFPFFFLVENSILLPELAEQNHTWCDGMYPHNILSFSFAVFHDNFTHFPSSQFHVDS